MKHCFLSLITGELCLAFHQGDGLEVVLHESEYAQLRAEVKRDIIAIRVKDVVLASSPRYKVRRSQGYLRTG